MLCCWRCARRTACCTAARCCWEAAGRGGGGWRWDVFSGTSLKKRSYSRKRNELNALLLLARCRGLSHTWLEFLKDVLADWGHTGNKAGCRHCSALLLPGHAGVCLGCPMGVPWVRPGCAEPLNRVYRAMHHGSVPGMCTYMWARVASARDCVQASAA